MARRPDPQFLRGQVSRRLRQLREPQGLTQGQVAHQMDWGLSKVVRIENANVSISTSDLRGLLRLYGVDEQASGDLIARAKDSKRLPWHSAYASVLNPSFRRLLAYESYASCIQHVHSSVIPGLLQTEGYARAVLALARDGQDLEQVLAARKDRLDQLTVDPPELHFVLDEGVIRREVGGRSAMREQLKALIVAAERPTTTIQLVPYDRGVYPGLAQPFLILQLTDDLDTGIDHVVFLENVRSDHLIDDDLAEIDGYRRKWDGARRHALSPSDSLKLIQQQIDQLGRPEG